MNSKVHNHWHIVVPHSNPSKVQKFSIDANIFYVKWRCNYCPQEFTVNVTRQGLHLNEFAEYQKALHQDKPTELDKSFFNPSLVKSIATQNTIQFPRHHLKKLTLISKLQHGVICRTIYLQYSKIHSFNHSSQVSTQCIKQHLKKCLPDLFSSQFILKSNVIAKK